MEWRNQRNHACHSFSKKHAQRVEEEGARDFQVGLTSKTRCALVERREQIFLLLGHKSHFQKTWWTWRIGRKEGWITCYALDYWHYGCLSTLVLTCRSRVGLKRIPTFSSQQSLPSQIHASLGIITHPVPSPRLILQPPSYNTNTGPQNANMTAISPSSL